MAEETVEIAIAEPQVETTVAAPSPNGKPSSLPSKALEIRDFDPDELTLDEAVLFETEGFTARGFRQFLIEHSNWTRQEIGRIKVKDLKDVADQLIARLAEISVPNAS